MKRKYWSIADGYILVKFMLTNSSNELLKGYRNDLDEGCSASEFIFSPMVFLHSSIHIREDSVCTQ